MTITEFFHGKRGREVTFGDMMRLIYGAEDTDMAVRAKLLPLTKKWEAAGCLHVTYPRRNVEDRMWRVIRAPQVVTAYMGAE